jgi:hypothetical protein
MAKCRYYLIVAKDHGYGDISQLMSQLEEVSKVRETETLLFCLLAFITPLY